MKKTTTFAVILTLAVALCFALVSVAQAGPGDPVTESWAKVNLVNKKIVAKIPIWQITREGTAKAVNWVNADNPRFAVYDPNGDSTDDPETWVDDLVLDKETGLEWERSPVPNDPWDSANSQCYRKELANRKGYRLPTIEELASLVDTENTNPALPTGHPFNVQFNVQDGGFWSSTTKGGTNGDFAWHVYFSSGKVDWTGKPYQFNVWCVRGGQGHDTFK